MNLVAIIGNVATKPELRHTASGKAVCSFRLAVQRNGGDDADFLSIVTWERQAEVCDRYLYVGRRVGVEGRLHQSTWETDEGKRSRVEVIAHRVELLGAPRAGEREQGSDSGDAGEESAQADRAESDAPERREVLVG